MWVKICGNTNLEDAQLAGELGADAVGFVFAPSIRHVTPAQVARIAAHLPETLERVGVFPAWKADDIADAVLTAGLTTVQLHGGLDIRLLHSLEDRFGSQLNIIQAVHWTVDDGGSNEGVVAAQLQKIRSSSRVSRVLVDSKVGASTGGTGIAFRWEAARTVFSDTYSVPKLILAGGLRPENIVDAIKQLAPWGVDVASGVETVPGQKDEKKLAHFMKGARELRD